MLITVNHRNMLLLYTFIVVKLSLHRFFAKVLIFSYVPVVFPPTIYELLDFETRPLPPPLNPV